VPEYSEAYKRGAEIRRQSLGEHGEARRRLFEAFDPLLMKYQMEFVFGEVMCRPGLDMKTRELITLALAIGLGRDREIRSHTRGFLNHGGTKEELVELILQLQVYAGFPAAVNGVYGIMEVFEERGLWKRPADAEA
jgi:4-carboxymuconolactone decarboxylase